jgi:hypothetical protein
LEKEGKRNAGEKSGSGRWEGRVSSGAEPNVRGENKDPEFGLSSTSEMPVVAGGAG